MVKQVSIEPKNPSNMPSFYKQTQKIQKILRLIKIFRSLTKQISSVPRNKSLNTSMCNRYTKSNILKNSYANESSLTNVSLGKTVNFWIFWLDLWSCLGYTKGSMELWDNNLPRIKILQLSSLLNLIYSHLFDSIVKFNEKWLIVEISVVLQASRYVWVIIKVWIILSLYYFM